MRWSDLQSASGQARSQNQVQLSFYFTGTFQTVGPPPVARRWSIKIHLTQWEVHLHSSSPSVPLVPSRAKAHICANTSSTPFTCWSIFTFKLQTRSSATVFGLYSSTDNSKYFEFTVMGRLNKGKQILRNQFLKNPLFLFQDSEFP